MKRADFPKAVSDFLSIYLPSQPRLCSFFSDVVREGTSFVRVYLEPASRLYSYLFLLCADVLPGSV